MPRAPIIPSTPTAALDSARLTYRRAPYEPDGPGSPAVNLVETTLPIPALGTQETITRRIADVPLSVFTSVTDTNAKQLHMKQVRAVLEWLRTEASLDP